MVSLLLPVESFQGDFCYRRLKVHGNRVGLNGGIHGCKEVRHEELPIEVVAVTSYVDVRS